MTMDIHQIRQHFDSLPKNHKLLIVVISLVLFTALIFPGSATVAETGSTVSVGQAAPGQRISVNLPDAIKNADETESLVIRSEQIQVKHALLSADVAGTAAFNEQSVVEQSAIQLSKADSASTTKEVVTEDSKPEPTGTELDYTEIEIVSNNDGSEHFSISENAELLPGQRYSLSLDESILDATDIVHFDDEEWHTFVVKRGDNLAKIFSRAGLTAKEVHHVSRAGKEARRLLKMKPGEAIELLKDNDGSFKQLNYAYSPTHALNVHKSGSKYQSNIEEKEVYSRLNYASGEIRSNFWNAGVDAGLSDNQIMSLATIFGWDIDFALDIRSGDSFNVIYEEIYIEGEFVGFGDIVAAEFSNQGEEFAAVRYTDGNYYTPAGRSMRKSFLRAPVNFKYISSSFKPRRFHPVQKRWKAHNGIDYAANTGTPVLAAGDGKVIQASYNRFNGNYVFIQHGDTYTTKYLHFSKRAVKTGQWVKQGQVIGYVGATGLASGPHLHYEFLVNGKHKNPRTVTLPKAVPIAKKEKAQFLALAKDYKAKLDNNRRIMLAMN